MKAHHVAIKIAPIIHLAELDVADDVIDDHDADRLALHVLLDKSGQERACILYCYVPLSSAHCVRALYEYTRNEWIVSPYVAIAA